MTKEKSKCCGSDVDPTGPDQSGKPQYVCRNCLCNCEVDVKCEPEKPSQESEGWVERFKEGFDEEFSFLHVRGCEVADNFSNKICNEGKDEGVSLSIDII
jgi:hypothetical protein